MILNKHPYNVLEKGHINDHTILARNRIFFILGKVYTDEGCIKLFYHTDRNN